MMEVAANVGPVVLACLEAETSLMNVVAEGLHASGNTVEQIGGVDINPQRLTAAGQHFGDRAIYIVCLPGGPSNPSAPMLRSTLSHQNIPVDRVLFVSSADSTQVLHQIRSALQRLAVSGALPSVPLPISPSSHSGEKQTPSQARVAPIPIWQYYGVAFGAVTLVFLFIVLIHNPRTQTSPASAHKSDTSHTTMRDSISAPSGGDSNSPAKRGHTNAGLDPNLDPNLEAQLETTSGTTRVMKALRTRKIRALDSLLATTNLHGPLDWQGAKSYCESLDVDGLTAWRIPDLGELQSLSNAHMLSGREFWSSVTSDLFGDTHWVWNASRRRVADHDGDAYAVCVRRVG